MERCDIMIHLGHELIKNISLLNMKLYLHDWQLAFVDWATYYDYQGKIETRLN